MSRVAIILSTFLALVTLVYLPLDEQRFQNHAQHEIIGYRYVRPGVAEEYNKAGTLTAVAANGVQTGEGAYLSPGLGQWDHDSADWTCVITADIDKMHQLPKLWILSQDHTAAHCFYKRHENNLNGYIHHAHMDPARMLLFSYITGLDPPALQMLIPAATSWGVTIGF
ncbi:hypothetical protein BDZ97DRAFT_1934162 [Flammula alnicola]|nr:hypothetical protein BDZ97DRAFT_1934162 [Flammula alnicola]